MKIGYWQTRGRAHPIRNLASFLNLQFTEKRYAFQNPNEWFQTDKSALNIPFPNLPYLIDDDFKLSESKAILQYLCIKAGKLEMLGKTPMDQVAMTQICGVKEDLIQELLKLAMETSENSKYAKFFDQKVFIKFNEMEKFFENRIYIAGDYLTFEDFDFAEFLLRFIALAKKTIQISLLDKYPNIKNTLNNFMSLSKVKEFYAKKEFDLPFWPPFAKIQD